MDRSWRRGWDKRQLLGLLLLTPDPLPIKSRETKPGLPLILREPLPTIVWQRHSCQAHTDEQQTGGEKTDRVHMKSPRCREVVEARVLLGPASLHSAQTPFPLAWKHLRAGFRVKQVINYTAASPTSACWGGYNPEKLYYGCWGARMGRARSLQTNTVTTSLQLSPTPTCGFSGPQIRSANASHGYSPGRGRRRSRAMSFVTKRANVPVTYWRRKTSGRIAAWPSQTAPSWREWRGDFRIRYFKIKA